MRYQSVGRWVVLFAGVAGGVVDAAPAPAPGAPAAAAAASPAGPAYVVKLTRPVKVGDRARFVAEATVLQTMTANLSGREKTLRPSTAFVRFDAVEHVLAVNASGEPTKASYTIQKCVIREGKGPELPFIETGRVVTVEAGRWKARVQLDEGTLSILDEMIVRRILPVTNQKGVTLDDCFGTKTPRRVGESWPVNAAALAKWASQEGVTVDPKHVTGSVKLKGLQEVNGVPHLLVQGRAVIQRWVPNPGDLPKGTKFVSGSDEIKFTKLLPTDPSGHCPTDSNSEKALMKVRTDDEEIGPEILVDAKVLRTVGIKRTPLPATGVASGAE